LKRLAIKRSCPHDPVGIPVCARVGVPPGVLDCVPGLDEPRDDRCPHSGRGCPVNSRLGRGHHRPHARHVPGGGASLAPVHVPRCGRGADRVYHSGGYVYRLRSVPDPATPLGTPCVGNDFSRACLDESFSRVVLGRHRLLGRRAVRGRHQSGSRLLGIRRIYVHLAGSRLPPLHSVCGYSSPSLPESDDRSSDWCGRSMGGQHPPCLTICRHGLHSRRAVGHERGPLDRHVSIPLHGPQSRCTPNSLREHRDRGVRAGSGGPTRRRERRRTRHAGRAGRRDRDPAPGPCSQRGVLRTRAGPDKPAGRHCDRGRSPFRLDRIVPPLLRGAGDAHRQHAQTGQRTDRGGGRGHRPVPAAEAT